VRPEVLDAPPGNILFVIDGDIIHECYNFSP
jgi:hypothetical protein